MWSVECGVWSVECGVWSVECGAWSVECSPGIRRHKRFCAAKTLPQGRFILPEDVISEGVPRAACRVGSRCYAL